LLAHIIIVVVVVVVVNMTIDIICDTQKGGKALSLWREGEMETKKKGGE